LHASCVRKSLTWLAKLGFSSLSAHKISAQNQEVIFLALLKRIFCALCRRSHFLFYLNLHFFMRFFTLFFLVLMTSGLAMGHLQAQTVHVVSNSGLEFTPADITIMAGDTVDWQIGGTHNVVEVSQATYDANGDAPLSGGFLTPFGGGKLAFETTGTFYYVCEPHAGLGMKGAITVQGTTSAVADFTPLSMDLRTLSPGHFELVLNQATAGKATLRVLDASGRAALSQSLTLSAGEQAIDLDLAPMSPGVYWIELRREGLAPATRPVIR
jgi:plastocyanin